jgi:hypothetical protein
LCNPFLIDQQVYDADKNAYTADGCTGGSKGYNRAFCVETDVSLGECNWRGTATSCSQTCKAGEFLLTQNTHIGFAKSGCKGGYFSSLCCEKVEIPTKDLVTCPYTNLNNVITGGHGPVVRDISNSKGYLGGSLIPPAECSYNPVGIDLSIRLGQEVANGAILNSIPGTWEAHVGGIADFKPSQNKPPKNKAKDISGCTTWLEDYHTTTTTVTSTKSIDCDEYAWPQACAHYNSVGSVMSQPVITCPWQSHGGNTRPAPTLWDKQHKSVWQSFVYTFKRPLFCQRDEYPPFYFMPTGYISNWPQSIRLLPSSQNRNAGQTWKGLCNTKAQNVMREGGSIADGTCQSTITTLRSVCAMSIVFDTRYLQQYDDLLSVNPCSINSRLTSDRGFVLLANDKWYGGHFASTHRPWSYSVKTIPSSLLNNLKRSIQTPKSDVLKHEQIEALAAHGYHLVSIPSSLVDLNSDFITGMTDPVLNLFLACCLMCPGKNMSANTPFLVVDAGNTTRRANDDDIAAILQILSREFVENECEYDEGYYSGPTMADEVPTATWDSPVTSSAVLASSLSMTLTAATNPAATAPKPVLTIVSSSEKPVPTESAEEHKRDQRVEDAADHKHAHLNHKYMHRRHRKSL